MNFLSGLMMITSRVKDHLTKIQYLTWEALFWVVGQSYSRNFANTHLFGSGREYKWYNRKRPLIRIPEKALRIWMGVGLFYFVPCYLCIVTPMPHKFLFKILGADRSFLIQRYCAHWLSHAKWRQRLFSPWLATDS